VLKKSPKQVGRAGEHYVAYLLESVGLEALRVDGTGCDLHVTTNSGSRVMRVEVKTCASRMLEKNTYRFHIGKSDAEVFVFVAIFDEPLVRMFLREDAPKWSLNSSEFTLEAQQADLEWFAQLS